MRKLFEQELKELLEELEILGRMVDDQWGKTMQALQTGDVKLAAEVVRGDREIDNKEQELERECLSLIALQQPMAKDLRTIAACLKVLTDVEREGDQCADVSEILCTGGINAESPLMRDILEMLEVSRGMFRRAMEVFLTRDVQEAEEICRMDDVVDNLFAKVIRDAAEGLPSSTNAMGEVDLLLERIGDHATNIAEWVIYIETGTHPDLNHSEEGIPE